MFCRLASFKSKSALIFQQSVEPKHLTKVGSNLVNVDAFASGRAGELHLHEDKLNSAPRIWAHFHFEMKLSGVFPDKLQGKLPMGSLYKFMSFYSFVLKPITLDWLESTVKPTFKTTNIYRLTFCQCVYCEYIPNFMFHQKQWRGRGRLLPDWVPPWRLHQWAGNLDPDVTVG